jgi:hypothetical protein
VASYKLTIPLDASGIPDFKPEQASRVIAVDAKGNISEQVVKFDAKGNGSATFTFDAAPGPLHVIAGPESATAKDLKNLQTLTVDVSAAQWANKSELAVTPIIIPPFYWSWWLRWCRTFTIRGRVLCADGSPVPGANVCAYDLDWWWWWLSEDLVGCATTDATGSFQITFRWCCGWWPWWWWSLRFWRLDLLLAERILPLIHEQATLPGLAVPTAKPDTSIFEKMLASRSPSGVPLPAPSLKLASVTPALSTTLSSTLSTSQLAAVGRPAVTKAVDPTALAGLRTKIVPLLPAATADIQRLRIWPWFDWAPWWDCSPDIIFKVTQNCAGVDSVIVDENIFNVRVDIPTTLDVTLTANDKACCIHNPNPPGGVCALLSGVCSETSAADLAINIGGNYGAPATPAGYQSPGAPGYDSDRPYGGTLSIFGQFGLGAAVDYYEFEYSDDGGTTWNVMPPGAVAAPSRYYFGPPLFGEPAFPPVRAVPYTLSIVNGRQVAESRTHFESVHGPGTWGLTHFWVSDWGELIDWVTDATTFPDNTYRLRVRTWTAANLAAYVAGDDPGKLSTLLPICDTKQENFLVLTLDNRLDPDPSHPTANHPCGSGTVHECTREPDTRFIAVKLVQAGHPDIDLAACSIKAMRPGDLLQIDFFAHDPDGHLAYYELFATYGDSLSTGVLGIGGPGYSLVPGAPYTAAPTPLVIPSALQVGPDYGAAVIAAPGIRPTWAGGTLRLTASAAAVFKEPCCYQLVLRAHKRTLTCGDESFWYHWNLSEYSFMITF